MKKPFLGQSVIFKDAVGQDRPAIIHTVWSDTCVNLTYFTDNGPIVQTSATLGEGPYQFSFQPE